MLRIFITFVCIIFAVAILFWPIGVAWSSPERSFMIGQLNNYDKAMLLQPSNLAFTTGLHMPGANHVGIAVRLEQQTASKDWWLKGMLCHMERTFYLRRMPIGTPATIAPYNLYLVHTYLLAALLLIFPFFTLVHIPIRRALRRRKNRCPKCNYDLRGAVAPLCPECGQEFKTRIPS
jgi:hypothetical protein